MDLKAGKRTHGILASSPRKRIKIHYQTSSDDAKCRARVAEPQELDMASFEDRAQTVQLAESSVIGRSKKQAKTVHRIESDSGDMLPGCGNSNLSLSVRGDFGEVSHESESSGMSFEDEVSAPRRRYGSAHAQYSQYHRFLDERSVRDLAYSSSAANNGIALGPGPARSLPPYERRSLSSPTISPPYQGPPCLRRFSLNLPMSVLASPPIQHHHAAYGPPAMQQQADWDQSSPLPMFASLATAAAAGQLEDGEFGLRVSPPAQELDAAASL